jgi:hypothetical protein
MLRFGRGLYLAMAARDLDHGYSAAAVVIGAHEDDVFSRLAGDTATAAAYVDGALRAGHQGHEDYSKSMPEVNDAGRIHCGEFACQSSQSPQFGINLANYAN